jgi:signal transduction histidine kinase
MFFGGFNGGTSFLPEAVADPSSAPRIVLTDFRLFGNPVEIGDHSALRESISYTRNLVLRRQQNVFSISFAALTYASPATNRYRYKLESLERQWNEVGSDRRQAIYTTLPSGTYTFRVQGATRGGPWSEPGVALRIQILPPWWNTRLFQAAAGALVFLITWAAYRHRLDQVASRFETRLAERARIAQDLHDTLLQGLVSASMQLHVAKKTLPEKSPAESRIGHVLELMKTLVEEGRNTVRGLRSEQEDLPDLENAFSHIVNEIPGPSDVKFRVLTDGSARPLHPVVQDEVYRIGREAILNAFRHASANVIEVSLYYQNKRFRLLVRDDGCGLDPDVQRFGREGHFGLPGMLERAERVGGQLRVLSRPGIGTDVELIVSGKSAYESPNGSRLRGWFGRRQGEGSGNSRIDKPEPKAEAE